MLYSRHSCESGNLGGNMKNKIRFLASLSVLLFLAGCPGSKKVAAVVNGQSITVDELDESYGGRIAQQIYSMRKNALDDLIDQKLLETEAKKRNMTVDLLFKEEVDSKVTDPTDEEIKTIYEANKDRIGQPFDQAKLQIANSLKQNRKNILKDQFLAKLKETSKIETTLKSPPVQRVTVSAGNTPILGNESAKVTLVEFSDYQCPFCGRARATVNQILDTYKDKIKYSFRDFPLSFHQDSFTAHVAARCAGDQGKYWDYNRILFNSQQALKPEKLKEYAKQLGLNVKDFNNCLDTNKYTAAVQKDMDEGAKAGVSGTPSFFIDGIMISGAQPFSKFKEIIDEELKK